MLNFNIFNTFELEKPALRENISYQVEYVNKDKPLDSIFGFLINKLKRKQKDTQWYIIFCQTRKQCSILYRFFSATLGKDMYLNNIPNPNSLVHMFHAGSPDSVKIMLWGKWHATDSYLRVLICTIAFGMGIDCKNVHHSIHFGPPSTVESLVQETGRLERDGQQCLIYTLYIQWFVICSLWCKDKGVFGSRNLPSKNDSKIVHCSCNSQTTWWVSLL